MLGPAKIFGNDAPLYAKYGGFYPVFRVTFGSIRQAVSKKVSLSKDRKRFSVSVPMQDLGFPSSIVAAYQCRRLAPNEFEYECGETALQAGDAALSELTNLLLHWRAIVERNPAIEQLLGVQMVLLEEC
jgi:hypothetical protein